MALAGLETCTALQELAGGLLAGTPLQACGIWGLFSGFVGFVRGFLRLNTGGAWPYRTLCSFFKSRSLMYFPQNVFFCCVVHLSSSRNISKYSLLQHHR